MWRIQHKCTVTQVELSDYAIMHGSRDGQDFTRFYCPKCKDEFVVVGDRFLKEAQQDGPGIPGFIMPSH